MGGIGSGRKPKPKSATNSQEAAPVLNFSHTESSLSIDTTSFKTPEKSRFHFVFL